MTRVSQLSTGVIHIASLAVNDRNQAIVRNENEPEMIKIYNRQTGELIREIKPHCSHLCLPLCEHQIDSDFFLEGCDGCAKIRIYNIITGEVKMVRNNCKPRDFCKGPNGSLLVFDYEGRLLQFSWNEEKHELILVRTISTRSRKVQKICYVEKSDIVVFVHGKDYMAAHDHNTDTNIWNTGILASKDPDFRGISCDLDGRIFVADGKNARLLVLRGQNGRVLQVALDSLDIGGIWDVCWSYTQPKLTVFHADTITCYNVEEQSDSDDDDIS